MNHDYCHCLDYDEATCPKTCFRALLVEDYRRLVETDMKNIPVSWANLRYSTLCPQDKPTGDAGKKPIGTWSEADTTPRGWRFRCSECGNVVCYVQPTRIKGWKKCCPYIFCPYCGTMMRSYIREE